MTTAAQYVAKAKSHIGASCEVNTCVSNGIHRWALETGLSYPKPTRGNPYPQASVSDLRSTIQQGGSNASGWKYHEGMTGVKVGDVLDWKHYAHVSVVHSIDRYGNIRSIGSGGPTGKVNYQPAGGGFNAPNNFRGYMRPAFKPTVIPKPPAPAHTSKLGSGQQLKPGQKLVAGKYSLVMQASDGHLVLYPKGKPGIALLPAFGKGTYLAMQTDGNLVVYRRSGSKSIVEHNFGTDGHPGAYLVLTTSSHVVIKTKSGKTLKTIR